MAQRGKGAGPPPPASKRSKDISREERYASVLKRLHRKGETEMRTATALSRAFDRLTNLIPAKEYIGAPLETEDTKKDAKEKGKGKGAKSGGRQKINRLHPGAITCTSEKLKEAHPDSTLRFTRSLSARFQKKQQQEKTKNKEGDEDTKAATGREALLQKLRQKIQEARGGKREGGYDGEGLSKRALRKQRAEAARKEAGGTGKGEGGGPVVKKEEERKAKRKRENTEDEGGEGDDVTFGQFRFNKSVAETSADLLEGNRPGSKAKKLKKAISAAEKEKEKLAAVADPEERKKAEMKLKMQKALQKSEGTKVKDNLAKLRKTQNALQKRKEQSQRKWRERKEQARMEGEEKLRQKAENLRKRKEGQKSPKQGPQTDPGAAKKTLKK
uniref:Ribosomal RNA-processing protein 14/surfeit locus protein 6 C-terminal domain-containing protein n=1 Tax=Chromera velia CCMP2878 TaxID=1169474 RepID=A0A0G4ICK4_9ALVE|eukprot:Cvel_13065.t1-p1 / transcript=Cvel_13065.t1 / gene=Cvel_13065 / organism=Chromera_velia_CCMP2878 / gene_product=Ribosomal RNA-processing protein 14-C, putative / transcript_product=Ribosomal RNA-processing protein 14-C, putative / location=Cvel_scaffold879:26407-31701(+) / protein_length=385 / sequence_SO=supercontig / SO=protein_coding / is_pseudo=false